MSLARRVGSGLASLILIQAILAGGLPPDARLMRAGAKTSAAYSSFDDDRAALGRASDLVDQARRATGSEQDRLAASALAELDAHPTLVADPWLRSPLARVPPDLAEAARRLQAALDLANSPTAPVDPVIARARLAEVMADSRFHPHDWLSYLPAFLVPLGLFVVALVQAAWSVVRWPFDRLFDLIGLILGSPLFGPAALVGAVIVTGGLVLLYRRGLGAALVGQAEARTATPDLPPTSQDALARAREQSAAGHYRDACHYVFLSTLLWIEERGITRFDRAATNREHLARLTRAASDPSTGIANALDPVVVRFDRVWYGQPTVTDADYQELLVLARRLEQVEE